MHSKGNWPGLYHAFHGGRADSACPEPLSRGGRDGISHADGGHSHLPGLGIPYLLLLLIAMVVTAFSCFLAGMERLSAGTELHGRERVLRFFAVSLVAWGASLLGFGELISLIYVFGAVSAVFLTGMAVHFCRVNWGNPNEKADGK